MILKPNVFGNAILYINNCILKILQRYLYSQKTKKEKSNFRFLFFKILYILKMKK